MTLNSANRPHRRQPPKHKWVMPVIVGVCLLIFAFIGIVLAVSGKHFF